MKHPSYAVAFVSMYFVTSTESHAIPRRCSAPGQISKKDYVNMPKGWQHALSCFYYNDGMEKDGMEGDGMKGDRMWDGRKWLEIEWWKMVGG